jgi:ABC-2 type transport system permease protein
MLLAQLRNELWKLFGKKRTYIGFASFLVVENGVSFALHKLHFSMARRLLEGNGYIAESYFSALTAAMIVLAPVLGLMLPLYVALIGGDLVAKEAEDGTLRMILCRPVSRTRLLVTKWLAGAVFSIALVVALAALGLVCARLWFPWTGMFVWSPEDQIFSVFDAGAGLARYCLATFFMLAPAFTILGLGFLFSCFNMKPAAATIIALSVCFADFVCCHIPYFQDHPNWFLTTHMHSWLWVFQDQIPWWKIAQSLFILAGFNLSFLIIGCAAFHVRDIKS